MRKSRIYTSVLLITTGLMIIQSCKKEEFVENQDNSTILTENSLSPEGMIELGKPLENPYSVNNMRAAYESLKSSSNQFKSDVNIEATHYYVRFLPKNYEELDLLEQDTNLILFDYPLDRKVKKGGTYYHDQSIPADKVTWQYTTVAVDYQFPSIQYEIIAELFLNESNSKLKSGRIDDFSYEQIEIQSLKLTGNYNDSLYSSSILKSSWIPSGTIRVYDHILNQQTPIVGAKVRVKNWFKVKETYTNSNGYFQTESFKNKVDYSIKWERNEFDIRSGTFGQAYYQGPNESISVWNLDIGSTGNSFGYATVHRAAYRYHYGNIGGMKRPGVWGKLKYCFFDKDGTGVNWGNWSLIGILPDILIYGKNGSTWKSSDNIFSTTIHETAHASHIELMNTGEIQFGQVTVQLRESWANSVEWFITQLEYFALGITNFDNPNIFPYSSFGDNMQWWRSTGSHDYTPLFIDLVDNYNQSLSHPSASMPSNRCPNGGSFDGANCYIGTPPSGETSFIYADNFYYTPVGCCSCPNVGTSFDGANCFVRSIPSNVVPFILNNSMYFMPAGDSRYPYDAVSGYTLAYIESNILKHSYGLSSLTSRLKSNKPTGVTDKQLDILLAYYFNL